MGSSPPTHLVLKSVGLATLFGEGLVPPSMTSIGGGPRKKIRKRVYIFCEDFTLRST